MGDLFLRVLTNDEKCFYRERWGGVNPWLCFFGLISMLVIGLVVGLAF